MNDFGNIYIKFGNEFWLILFREYIIHNLFAVQTADRLTKDRRRADEQRL
jgi:hypothetical protein